MQNKKVWWDSCRYEHTGKRPNEWQQQLPQVAHRARW
jgi:hypothetical protein